MRDEATKLGGILLLAFVVALVVATVAGVGATVAEGLEGLELSPTTTTSAP